MFILFCFSHQQYDWNTICMRRGPTFAIRWIRISEQYDIEEKQSRKRVTFCQTFISYGKLCLSLTRDYAGLQFENNFLILSSMMRISVGENHCAYLLSRFPLTGSGKVILIKFQCHLLGNSVLYVVLDNCSRQNDARLYKNPIRLHIEYCYQNNSGTSDISLGISASVIFS